MPIKSNKLLQFEPNALDLQPRKIEPHDDDPGELFEPLSIEHGPDGFRFNADRWSCSSNEEGQETSNSNNANSVSRWLSNCTPRQQRYYGDSTGNTMTDITASRTQSSRKSSTGQQKAEISRLMAINRDLSAQYGALQSQFSRLMAEHNRLKHKHNALELASMQTSQASYFIYSETKSFIILYKQD